MAELIESSIVQQQNINLVAWLQQRQTQNQFIIQYYNRTALERIGWWVCNENEIADLAIRICNDNNILFIVPLTADGIARLAEPHRL